MLRIGLLSDTHGYWDNKYATYFHSCDEIWHTGDIGSEDIASRLSAIKPLRAVYGNIDGGALRTMYKAVEVFQVEGVKVMMTHIGGYPGRYAPGIKEMLKEARPKLFISGHSHILKVMYDKNLQCLHINPGAAGKSGFHQVRTLIRFSVREDAIEDLEVIELKD